MLTPITPELPETPKPIRRTSQLPDTEVALAALATAAAKAWQTSELPDLLWLRKADLLDQAAAYTRHLDAADAAGDQRTPQAQRLQALDATLDKHLKFVKGYLTEEYEEDEARAYYPEFGIGTKRFRLPTARPERVKSLGKLLDALKAHDFGKKKYGTAFWQPLADEYTRLVTESTDTAGQRSSKVSEKGSGEKQIRKALRALIHHIKANYPDTFEAQLRAFGFQKESY